jgi:hypothetical protein
MCAGLLLCARQSISSQLLKTRQLRTCDGRNRQVGQPFVGVSSKQRPRRDWTGPRASALGMAQDGPTNGRAESGPQFASSSRTHRAVFAVQGRGSHTLHNKTPTVNRQLANSISFASWCRHGLSSRDRSIGNGGRSSGSAISAGGPAWANGSWGECLAEWLWDSGVSDDNAGWLSFAPLLQEGKYFVSYFGSWYVCSLCLLCMRLLGCVRHMQLQLLGRSFARMMCLCNTQTNIFSMIRSHLSLL